MEARQVVLNFWEQMQNNDWVGASMLLSESFVGFWPQSGEKIIGRDNFVNVNGNYPASGRWQFDLNSIVAENNVVVTDVSITDGDVQARAITFSTVIDGLIAKQTEFWPDPMPAAAWRRQWVQLEE